MSWSFQYEFAKGIDGSYLVTNPINNPDNTYSVRFTFIPEEIPIEMYAEEDYQIVLKRYNQALRYAKLIKVFKAETIKFEMID